MVNIAKEMVKRKDEQQTEFSMAEYDNGCVLLPGALGQNAVGDRFNTDAGSRDYSDPRR